MTATARRRGIVATIVIAPAPDDGLSIPFLDMDDTQYEYING